MSFKFKVALIFLLLNPFLSFGQENFFDLCWQESKNCLKTSNIDSCDMTVIKNMIGNKLPTSDWISLNHTTPLAVIGNDSIIFLHFWMKHCGPCIRQLPILNDLVKHFHDQPIKFVAYGIDDEADLQDFLKKNTFLFEIVPYQGKFLEKYCLFKGFPIDMITDRKGIVTDVIFNDNSSYKNTFKAYEKIILTNLK